MRYKYRYLKWDSKPNKIKTITKILDKYSIKFSYKEDHYSVLDSFKYKLEFFVYEEMDFYEKLFCKLKKFNLYRNLLIEYDEIDMENAQWYIIGTSQYQYPQPEDDFGYRNLTFNLDNYCPLCGIGKIQNNPYRLKYEPKQKPNLFWGLHWEYEPIFIREEIKNIFEKEKIGGVYFSQPVIHKSNKPIERFYQLHIETILDKGLITDNVNTVTCKINNEENSNRNNELKCCGRIKYNSYRALEFNKKIFSTDNDFYLTNEYFGSMGSAYRKKIISKKIYNLIKNYKLRGLYFDPLT
jgi:uncharacterized protein YutE (UPF0331/DUF86 family)